MAIGLIQLQAVGAEMAAAELDLEARAGLSEIVKPDQRHNPAFRTWRGDGTMHGGQQHRCNGSNVEKMRQQWVAGLFWP